MDVIRSCDREPQSNVMSKELSNIGDGAVAAWARRDRAMEQRLEATAYIMSRAMAAVDASGQFPRLADALEEAVRQFEHGSVALLMNLTPAAADAARRMLEVVFFTVFMRGDPIGLLLGTPAPRSSASPDPSSNISRGREQLSPTARMEKSSRLACTSVQVPVYMPIRESGLKAESG